MKHKLTKTDFIHYLNCPSSLWLAKNEPKIFKEYKSEFSLFLKKIIKDGYEVEEYAKKIFSTGIEVPVTFDDEIDAEETKRILEKKEIDKQYLSVKKKIFFQPTFLTPQGLFARADILKKNIDGSYDIYEVKSSTKIKKDKKHNHLKDICFQKYVLEKLNYRIKNSFLIHLNSDFKKDGIIDENKLLKIVNVNEEISNLYENVSQDIENALISIQRQEINKNICPCFRKTRSNHCDTFSYFNKNYNSEYIHNLQRIGEKKISELLEIEVEKILDIPLEYELSEKQLLQKESLLQKKALINELAIEKTLNNLIFPLYFFDYETIPLAIPKIEDFSPHQHLPFQFSLHILAEDGSIKHFEYLAEKFEKPEKLILFMKKVIGKTGNLISWYASFEKTQNKKMIEIFPQHQSFLEDINKRTFDLMSIFTLDYVDYKFDGSTSIKKVLPIIVPKLSYKTLEGVQDGAGAIEQGEKMLLMPNSTKKDIIRKNLLKYCELDTFAMVEIYRKLKTL